MSVWKRMLQATAGLFLSGFSGTAGCLAAGENDAPARAKPPSYFGINGTKAFHVNSPDSAAVAQRLGWMTELGVTDDRSDLWWHVVEPAPGEYDWSRSDRVFSEFERAGVQWYPILCYGAAWWEDRNAPANDAEIGQFANYVFQTLSRYKGRAPYWSLWNEPNIPSFWAPQPDAERYAALLESAHMAARRADPAALICAPVTAPLGGLDRRFIERLFQLGSLEHFDVFDYHYYRNYAPEDEVPDEIALIRALMARYGEEKPIWISETGVTSGTPEDVSASGTTGTASRKYTYDRQASYVVRNHLLCLALGVEKIFYFDLQNWFDDQPEVWDSTLGLVDAAGRRKPSFEAYRKMVETVDGMEFVGRCSDLGDGIEGVLIRNPATNEYTVAAWTRSEGESRALSLASAGPSFSGTGGPEAAAGAAEASLIPAVLNHHPQYFPGVDGSRYAADAAIQLLPARTILSPGDSRSLRLTTGSAHLVSPSVVVTATTVPEGLFWDPSSGAIGVSDDAPSGVHRIVVGAEVVYGPETNRRTARVLRSAVIEIVPTLTVSVRPGDNPRSLMCADAASSAAVAEESFIVETTLRNSSGRELSGTLALFFEPEDRPAAFPAALAPENVILAPYSTKRVELTLPMAPLRGLSSVAALRAEFGFHRSPPFRVLPVAFSSDGLRPVIDGELDDWPQGAPVLRLGDERQLTRNSSPDFLPADSSAAVRFWFTPDTMHVAARISDDEAPYNPHPPLQMWSGDALELYLGLCGPSRRAVINKDFEYQLGLAPTTGHGTPSAFYFHADVPLRQAQVAVRVMEGGYDLEASIPLGELNTPLPPLEAGSLIGLDVALDDLDRDDQAPAGNLPGRSMTWNGSPRNWIDPSGWGLGILIPLDGM